MSQAGPGSWGSLRRESDTAAGGVVSPGGVDGEGGEGEAAAWRGLHEEGAASWRPAGDSGAGKTSTPIAAAAAGGQEPSGRRWFAMSRSRPAFRRIISRRSLAASTCAASAAGDEDWDALPTPPGPAKVSEADRRTARPSRTPSEPAAAGVWAGNRKHS